MACLTLETLNFQTLGLLVRPARVPWPGQALPPASAGPGPPGLRAGHHLTWALFQLLTVNPKHRVSSLQDMKVTPSLANVLWDDLSKKKVEPGFVPNVSLQDGRPGQGLQGGTG